jgi:hypothetical protein
MIRTRLSMIGVVCILGLSAASWADLSMVETAIHGSKMEQKSRKSWRSAR